MFVEQMLGNGKKTYILGRSKDIDWYLEMNPQWRSNPNSTDQILRIDAWTLDVNKEWIRKAADEVKSGVAQIEIIPSEDMDGSVYEQELKWLGEYGLEYSPFDGTFVPRGSALSASHLPPRARGIREMY